MQLRTKLRSSKEDSKVVERDLTGARNDVNKKTHKLRDQLTQAQTAARKQLTDLSIHGHRATKKLQEVTDKVKRVFQSLRRLVCSIRLLCPSVSG